jgi:hypothetical protein
MAAMADHRDGLKGLIHDVLHHATAVVMLKEESVEANREGVGGLE